MTTAPPGGAAPSRLPVEDASQVPLARALAVRAATGEGLTAHQVQTVALVATELAENLHRHAVGGELVLVPGRTQPDAGVAGAAALWVIAVDRGPGVHRFERCLADGFSTGGTLGTGLGAVVRLSDAFDAVSEPGRGTVVAAGFDAAGSPGAGPRARAAVDAAGLGFPITGEEVNGDGWGLVVRGSRVLLVVADGLGHGPLAAEASTAATRAALEVAHLEPAPLLVEVSRRIAATRGAAVTVADVELAALVDGGAVTGAGLGNVSMLLAGPDGATRRTPTSHGTAGASARVSPRPQTQPLPAGGAVVLHSDGLTSRWDLTGRAELLRHSALVVCAALLRDHARGSDDALVAVLRAAPRSGADPAGAGVGG